MRVKNGELTERGLARMIGISQPHMHHILSGARTLSIENSDRILKNLGLTVSDLLALLEPPRIAPRSSEVSFGRGQTQEYVSESRKILNS